MLILSIDTSTQKGVSQIVVQMSEGHGQIVMETLARAETNGAPTFCQLTEDLQMQVKIVQRKTVPGQVAVVTNFLVIGDLIPQEKWSDGSGELIRLAHDKADPPKTKIIN